MVHSIVRWKEKKTVIFGITDKGIKEIINSYRYEITTPDFRSDSIFHDLGLVLLRERLEKTKTMVEYLSESMLHSCDDFKDDEKLSAYSRMNSDAALAIETDKNKFHVALEYEISDKQYSRYVKKLEDYYESSSIAGVFYVCGNTKIENLIRKADEEFSQKHDTKVFTCLEENVYKSVGPLPFINRQNAKFFLL